MITRLFTFSCFLIAFQSCAQSTYEHKIDRLFSTYQAHTPGASVLVARDTNILYQRHFGLANLEYQIPIQANTVFNATSLSKSFVAFGIYLLEVDNQLSFDDPIQQYLPDFPEHDSPIQIRHLLTHTSGIPDQRGLLAISGFYLGDYVSNDQIIHLLSGQSKLNFQPGSQFEYGHSNYTLLGRIIEIVTGKTLNSFLQETIFLPLEMHHTFILESTDQIIENRADSYAFHTDSTYSKVVLNQANYGPTNLMSTAEDLQKWLFALHNKSIGSPALIQRFNKVAQSPQGKPVVAADLGQEQILAAQGQFFRKYKDYDLYSHGGSLGGFRSFMGWFPDEQLSIIILMNEKSLNPYPFALQIADLILETEQPPSIAKPLSKSSNSKHPPEIQMREPYEYLGNYYNADLNATIQVRKKEKSLVFSLGNHRNIKGTLIDSDQFTLPLMHQVNLTFLKNSAGKIDSIQASSLGVQNCVFTKLD